MRLFIYLLIITGIIFTLQLWHQVPAEEKTAAVPTPMPFGNALGVLFVFLLLSLAIYSTLAALKTNKGLKLFILLVIAWGFPLFGPAIVYFTSIKGGVKEPQPQQLPQPLKSNFQPAHGNTISYIS